MTERKVPVLLWVGILLAPYIFAWFLLKPDYSKKAKVVSFAWMIIVLFMFFGRECSGSGSRSTKDEIANLTEESAVRETSDAPEQVVDALPTKSTNWEDYMPAKEKQFVELLQKGWGKNEYDLTEAEKYEFVSGRKKGLNSLFGGNYAFNNWLGAVVRVDYKIDNDELAIAIDLVENPGYDEGIRFYTGVSQNRNNRIGTTLKQSSPYFKKALELESGDIVKCSGTFYNTDPMPLSKNWKIENPLGEFGSISLLSKFSKIEKFDIDKEPEPPNAKND
ncbi:MAG: hypothetical protein PHY48_13120 [Candidatus Cloacimonetes bacterium]|jgi:hypothetical protein|nr:hypothetical protein [Candidatus Cloacimonadota bacterium]